ncbi:MAG: sugar transporter [Dysgonomonas sp.]
MILNKKQVDIKKWLPLIGLSLSAFIFNTTEFIPIGLLSDIAADFKITESKAGFLISAYAWVVGIASLPLMLICSKLERRLLLTILFTLFIGCHILSFLASSYTVLLISRLGIACSHAVFWSITSPLAVRVAPEGYRSFGLSLVAAGSSIAMVLGLPLGRIIGLHFGWRITFLTIAISAFIILIVLRSILPKLESSNSGTIKHLPALFKRPALVCLYILTAVAITAHFTCYSYIEPFLTNGAGFSPDFGTLVLLLYGLAGIGGSFIFSRNNDKNQSNLAVIAIGGITLSMLLLYVFSLNTYSVLILCAFWGIAITLFNLVFQYQVIRLAPDATAIAMSIYSGIYNVGIGSGALIGGLVYAHSSVNNVGYVGGIIGIFAFIFFYIFLKKYFQNTQN